MSEEHAADYLEQDTAFIEAAQENARALIEFLPQLGQNIKDIMPKARKGWNLFKKDAPDLEAEFARTQARGIVDQELKHRLQSITDDITSETKKALAINGGGYFSEYGLGDCQIDDLAENVTQYLDEHPEKVEFLGQKAVLKVLYDACIEMRTGEIEPSATNSAPVGLDEAMLPKYLESAIEQYCDALFEKIGDAYYHDSADLQIAMQPS